MPFSSHSNRAPVLELLKQFNAKIIFDIGIGYGEFGPLIKKNIPDATVYGLEIFGPYLEKVQHEYYAAIFLDDMRAFDYSLFPCDAVILIDSLEHIDRIEGMALLNKLEKMFPLIILSLPIVDYPQGPFFENEHEAHKTQWKQNELEGLGYTMKFTDRQIGVFYKKVVT